MTRRAKIALAGPPGSMVIVFGASWGFDDYATGEALADLVVAFGFLLAGLVACSRRPDSRSGVLMAALGIVWTIPNWRFAEGSALLHTAGALSFGPLFALGLYTLLSFPTGRLPDARADRFAWRAGFVLTVPLHFAAMLVYAPVDMDCADCAPGLNLVQVTDDPELSRAVSSSWRLALVLVALVVAVRLVQRFLRSTRPGRRVYGPLLAGAASATVLTGAGSAIVLFWTEDPNGIALFFFLAGTACVPVGMLVGVLRTRAGGAPLADLLLRLHEVPTGGALRDVLAEALGDPSLRIALWAPSVNHFVDEAGRRLDIRGTSTEVPGANGPLAILLHDPALVEDRRMLDSVVVAARLALENERLQAEVRAQLAEVRASRARIVEAADEERRRIERDLHDGAQQRLVSMALGLELVRDRVREDPAVGELLAAVTEEAQSAIAELRELAQGIHPAVLTDQGLHEALYFLASRSPVPVEIDSELEGRRLPVPVEVAAYYACAEALTNAAKHARATRVEIEAAARDGHLRVVIGDDGVGGADPGSGSGLRGLDDRVSALGGRLQVEDGDAGGTRVQVELPLVEPR